MLSLFVGCNSFTAAPVQRFASAPWRAEPTLSAVDRRALITGAAFAAASLMAPAAHAEYGADKDEAYTYDLSIKNVEGDSALYTPTAKLLQKGSKLAKVEVSMPSPGPLAAKDYVDCMWLRDAKTGSVIDAAFFYPNGKPQAKGRSGAPSDGSAPIEPSFVLRVPVDSTGGGSKVVPVVHSAAGRVWEGAALATK